MSISRELILRYADPTAFRKGLFIQAGADVAPFASVMADFQRRDFINLDSGFRALAGGEKPALRRYWLERTKGGSKDTDLTVALLWLLIYTRRPLRIQIGAYDSDQADEVRLIAKQLQGLEGPVNRMVAEFVDVQSDKFICKRTKSAAEIMTTDSLGSHGARPDVVLLNELSHITNREFAQTLLDNADKVPSSIVVITSNAGTIDSLQYEWRRIASESPRWVFSVLDKPAPWITEADLEESRLRNPPSRFERLWGGRWVRGSGDALDLAIIEAAVIKDMAPARQAEPNCIYAAGLDLGIRQDHSALVIIGYRTQQERYFLAGCLSWAPTGKTEVDLQTVENAVLQAHARFNLRAVGYDPSQAIHLAQRCNRRGVRMQEVPFVGRNLHSMAETLIEVFNTRAIDLYDDPQLIRDLGRLSIAEKPYGFRLEAVSDATGHADRAIAMSICLPILRGIVANVSHHRSAGVVGMRVEPPPSRRHGVLLDTSARTPWNPWTRH